jgi:hypothetical protein
MVKYQESSADRIWKEKLDECVSPEHAFVLFAIIVAVVVGLLAAAGWRLAIA